MSSPTVLVIRATGTQGRSVCHKLLSKSFRVNAIVRDAKEARAAALQDAGVTVFEGSIDDKATLDRALQGCTHLFLALMPRFDEEASELRQAKFIVSAALSGPTPVRHIVLSTALSSPATDGSLTNQFFKIAKENKLRVEDEVRNAGFDTWTILRPGYFMSNFLWPLGDVMFPELAREHRFVTALEEHTILPLIDPDDIGGFAAAAFEEPVKFDKQVLSISSEGKQTVDVIRTLEKASGKHIESSYISEGEAKELAKTNPIIAGQLLTRSLHDLIDYEGLKQWGVPLGTFDGFLAREEELVKKTFEPDGKPLDLFEAANKPS